MVASFATLNEYKTDSPTDTEVPDFNDPQTFLGLQAELGQALSEISREGSPRPPSPVTPEARSRSGSVSSGASPIHRMSGVAGPADTITLTREQLQELIRTVQDNRQEQTVRRPKIKTPDTFTGDRTKLRAWLVQLAMYYTALGWGENEDGLKVDFAKSLLRESAGKWITPYVEGKTPATWNNWAEFQATLRIQFGDVDARETARNKIEKIKQGSRNVTDFWNELRLLATEAEYDEATLGRAFLRGLHEEIQNAWAMRAQDFTTTEEMAVWAINQENRLDVIKHVQGRSKTKTYDNVRNYDGTFKTQRLQESRGDPMDLDATRRRQALNISKTEYWRRRNNNLCMACAKPGHMMRNCTNPKDEKEYPARTVSRVQNPRWKQRTAIREMDLESEKNEEEKDDGPQ